MIDWSPALQVAASAAGSASEAIANWKNESAACKAIRKLFLHTVVDERGGIQKDFHRSQVADISFVATKLMLDGLVERRVHSVEVSNLTLPLHDPGRVRYFGYDSTTYKFWLENPTQNHVFSSPGVWPPLDAKRALTTEIIREINQKRITWFERPIDSVEKACVSVPFVTPFYAGDVALGRRKEKKLTADLTRLLHENCTRGQYRIPAECHQASIGDFSFWLTPLHSIISDRLVSYYFVVRHNKLSVHPKRAVAFHYWPDSGLHWVKIKIING
jgi:hypothetical protein